MSLVLGITLEKIIKPIVTIIKVLSMNILVLELEIEIL